MRLTVGGNEVFIASGGRDFDPALPAIVFLHGAGLDHSVWALLARSFAHRGSSVLADKVAALGLICTAAPMRVADDLLAAAKANDHAAIDMIVRWGYGARAALGGCEIPGLWMAGGGERLLERAAPGVLFADLVACNDYRDALAAAAKVKGPARVILGSRDLMTPVKNGKAVADAMASCRLIVLDGAGHMLMSERPDEVLAALTRENGD
jgi:pimeloyl-ACP methyl ester carboxylesterase